MTKWEIIKDFILKSVLPVLFVLLLYSMFISLCTKNGTVDYIKLFIICGIPFGITRLVIFPLGGMNGFLASLIFGVIIGGIIGGFILVYRLLIAVWYVPLTIVRFTAAHNMKTA